MKVEINPTEHEVASIIPPQADDALHFIRARNQSYHFDLNEEEERKLTQKIDWMLMPLM
jgi:hypothetical protein